jgi:succinate dehydrogenase hydrophobic anchor subunit
MSEANWKEEISCKRTHQQRDGKRTKKHPLYHNGRALWHRITPRSSKHSERQQKCGGEKKCSKKKKKKMAERERVGTRETYQRKNKNKCAREKGWPSGKRGEYNSSSIALVCLFCFFVLFCFFLEERPPQYTSSKKHQNRILKNGTLVVLLLGHPPVHFFLGCRRISDVVVSRTYWRMLCDEERRCLDLVTTQGQVGRCVMAQ